MEYGGYLFTKIRYADYDVLVPFVCERCGWCCEHYLPRFTESEILRIADDAHRQRDETLRQYLEGYEKKRHGREVGCIFLLGSGLCGIHNHPLRPEVCRLYPFSFLNGDERCPSFCDHHRIVLALTRDAGAFDLYDSSFCPEIGLRPVPGDLWPATLHRFLDADPPAEAIAPFIVFNHPPLPEAGMRKVPPVEIRA
jgi:Fe-S-cluster containining protein